MTTTWKGAKAFTKGREGKKVKFIAIHWVGNGDLDSASAWFNRATAKTSAHYGVEDAKVYQWVKDEDTAWAVGDWVGNLESISIEHSATPTRPATEQTYITSAELIKTLCKKFNLEINKETIRPHKSYKATQCPGTIDIDKLISLAKGNMNFIDLRKRLSDVSWAELKEFTSLEKLGLIERADSIQTMMMKWLKSNSDMSINQANSLDLLSKRDETIVNLNKEISDLKTAIDAPETASTDEIKVLIDRADSLQKANDTQLAIIRSFDETNNLFNLIKSWLKK